MSNYASESSDDLSNYLSKFGLEATSGNIAHHQASPREQGNRRIYDQISKIAVIGQNKGNPMD